MNLSFSRSSRTPSCYLGIFVTLVITTAFDYGITKWKGKMFFHEVLSERIFFFHLVLHNRERSKLRKERRHDSYKDKSIKHFEIEQPVQNTNN